MEASGSCLHVSYVYIHLDAGSYPLYSYTFRDFIFVVNATRHNVQTHEEYGAVHLLQYLRTVSIYLSIYLSVSWYSPHTRSIVGGV